MLKPILNDILNSIEKRLNNPTGRDMSQYITKRLDISLSFYSQELERICNKILNINNLNALKALNREMEEKNKNGKTK